jgi:hypothetical protein
MRLIKGMARRGWIEFPMSNVCLRARIVKRCSCMKSRCRLPACLALTAVLAFPFVVVPTTAEAQVVTCPSASPGAKYGSCAAANRGTSAAVTSSTVVLTCSSGAVTYGGDVNTCAYAVWYPWSYMDYNTPILTTYAGWQQRNNITWNNAAPAPPTGSVTGPAQISWVAPAVDVNGLPITVTGYVIQYGTTDFSQSVTVAANITTYTFQNLQSGTWQFRVIAKDSSGASAPSNPVTLVIAGNQVCGNAPPVATQTVACPAGTTGTWTQTHIWSPVAYPTCWNANAWTPSSPPAGSCPAGGQTWKTTASESVFEAVLPLSGTALVQGNNLGTIAAGKPCGAEQYKIGTASYRRITDSDAALKSPTYAGRNNTAVCTLQ